MRKFDYPLDMNLLETSKLLKREVLIAKVVPTQSIEHIIFHAQPSNRIHRAILELENPYPPDDLTSNYKSILRVRDFLHAYKL